jgi:hypothetical protein
MRILVFINTMISVASKTFKNAYFWKCIIVYWMAKRKKSYEFVSKAKIELNLFQQFFTPHTPPLKQGESETTLSPDLPSTRILRSTIPFRKCFKSCSPLSDLLNRYGPQATTRFNMPSFSPILEHETSKSECR